MPSNSSRNAVTHGIHTSVVVLRNENDELYRQLEADHTALWNPVGPLERVLVAEIVTAEWRLRRTWQTETAALDLQMDRDAPALHKEIGPCDEPVRTAVAFTHIAGESFFLDNMHRNETRFSRMIDRAAARLTALQERRLRKAQPPQDQQNKTILQNEKDTPTEVRQ
jgi:hypothetical protein